MPLHVVLVHPEIPQNTGNIARTCAATGARLHLIEPLGFSLDSRYLKRAGLDYWHMMVYDTWPDWDSFAASHPGARFILTSRKAARSHADVTYRNGDYLVFGCESKGLDDSLLAAYEDSCVRIPMIPEARSLNLSNSVAIMVYEALRQLDFPGLSDEGSMINPPAQWQDYL